MSIIKTIAFTAFTAVVLFLAACGTGQLQRVGLAPSSSADALAQGNWARDEFDLQRVGPLLERSHNPEEFETYLNERNGINNLDLNGDGYADYLSVDEYYDRGPYARGLSIYDRLGPDLIQEVATVVFYRDDPTWPGARVLVTGDDVIYGDDVYYVTDWYDRPVDFITYEFTTHDPYASPYYYGYYPADYSVYNVVDTPVYVTRVQQFDPQPVLVYTQRPDFISKIRITSPNADKHFDQAFAKMVKPTREQQRFLAENHARPERAQERPGKIEAPPGQEKARGENFPQRQEKARNNDLLPAQAKVHIAEKPRGNEHQRMTEQPREQFRQPRQQQQHVNSERMSPPLANNPRPHGGGRPMPVFTKPAPQFSRPPQAARSGPPAGRRGPPAEHQHGPPAQRGGGGKKKG